MKKIITLICFLGLAACQHSLKQNRKPNAVNDSTNYMQLGSITYQDRSLNVDDEMDQTYGISSSTVGIGRNGKPILRITTLDDAKYDFAIVLDTRPEAVQLAHLLKYSNVRIICDPNNSTKHSTGDNTKLARPPLKSHTHYIVCKIDRIHFN